MTEVESGSHLAGALVTIPLLCPCYKEFVPVLGLEAMRRMRGMRGPRVF